MVEHPPANTHCARCGRILHSPNSVALGYGPTCFRKIRAAAEVVDLSAYKREQVKKAAELLAHGGVIRAGHLYLVASSDGSARYQTSPTSGTCTCKAGQHGRRCYHLAAATVLAAA